MENTVLEVNGLSVDLLTRLSYPSHLGLSLKRTLRHFDKEALLAELFSMADWLDEHPELSSVALDYRIKSYASIHDKYDRYCGSSRQTGKVFNDILGFRAFCDDYNEVVGLKSDIFTVADMSEGKANDDGYRGVHLYFQLDNEHYPIEIQYNTLYDRQFNNWLHDYLYKKNYPSEIGRLLRSQYERGRIKNVVSFEEALKNVLSGSEG